MNIKKMVGKTGISSYPMDQWTKIFAGALCAKLNSKILDILVVVQYGQMQELQSDCILEDSGKEG